MHIVRNVGTNSVINYEINRPTIVTQIVQTQQTIPPTIHPPPGSIYRYQLSHSIPRINLLALETHSRVFIYTLRTFFSNFTLPTLSPHLPLIEEMVLTVAGARRQVRDRTMKFNWGTRLSLVILHFNWLHDCTVFLQATPCKIICRSSPLYSRRLKGGVIEFHGSSNWVMGSRSRPGICNSF